MPFLTLPPAFKEAKPGIQLLLFFCFWIVFSSFFAILSAFLAANVFDLPQPTADLSPEIISRYKIIQFITSIGIFILPPLLLAGLFTDRKWEFLALRKRPSINSLVLVFLILFFSIPVLNLLIQWNMDLNLPEFMEPLELAMKKMEQDAAELTEMFLKAENTTGLMVNLVLIGLIPAVGEELLFRGVFQEFVRRWLGNKHWAIWIAAFFFSMLHFQFYGFFPRMLLGVLFGYLLAWSGSLWVPIFAHFLNNSSAVIISYVTRGTSFQEKLDTLGTDHETWYYIIPGTIILALMLWFFYRENQETAMENSVDQ